MNIEEDTKGVNTNRGVNRRTKTDEIGRSSIGTSLDRVEFEKMETNTSISNNKSTQTRQIHQYKVGANINLPFNNFTQTQRPSENNMGINTDIRLTNSAQNIPLHNISRGMNMENNTTSKDCQCGYQEMCQPLTHFQSNFATELEQSQAIGRRFAIENMQWTIPDTIVLH